MRAAVCSVSARSVSARRAGSALTIGVGVKPESPLRFVATEAHGPLGRAVRSYANLLMRLPVRIARGDVTKIKFGFMNWYPAPTSDRAAVGIGNDFTIDKAAVEFNGNYVPLTFDDLPSKVVENGAPHVLSDFADLTALGVSKLSAGNVVYLRVEASVPSSTSYWPAGYNTSAATGFSAQYFNPANTSVINGAYGAGEFATSGSATVANLYQIPVVPLGCYSSDGQDKSAIVMGASIDTRLNDNDNYNWTAESGGGFWGRAFYRLNVPYLNLGVPSATSKMYANGPQFFDPWFAYAKYACEGISGNDLSRGYTAADIKSRLIPRAAAMRTAGIKKIMRAPIGPHTTSTDAWATDANQTINSGFGVGSYADELNGWYSTSGIYDAVMPITAYHSASSIWLWKSGTTIDGTHPTAACHAAMATDMQATIAAEFGL